MMKTRTVEPTDSEQEREQRVAELSREIGPDWADQFQPGSFGCHELLDRTALAARLVEESIQSHPACLHNPEWFALADRASTALAELYQRIGAEHLGGGNDESDSREVRANG